MLTEQIPPGDDIPYNINVIIEIPAYGDPVKYEINKEAGCLCVDRFMATAMRYPCNYGYIPQTSAADGDPVDVLVITPFPLLSGAMVKCRPIGVLKMTDEKGQDNKVLSVPNDDITDLYHNVKTLDDLPKTLLHSIRHFFEHYKDLEPGKWVKIEGWQGLDAAYEEVAKGVSL